MTKTVHWKILHSMVQLSGHTSFTMQVCMGGGGVVLIWCKHLAFWDPFGAQVGLRVNFTPLGTRVATQSAN